MPAPHGPVAGAAIIILLPGPPTAHQQSRCPPIGTEKGWMTAWTGKDAEAFANGTAVLAAPDTSTSKPRGGSTRRMPIGVPSDRCSAHIVAKAVHARQATHNGHLHARGRSADGAPVLSAVLPASRSPPSDAPQVVISGSLLASPAAGSPPGLGAAQTCEGSTTPPPPPPPPHSRPAWGVCSVPATGRAELLNHATEEAAPSWLEPVVRR